MHGCCSRPAALKLTNRAASREPAAQAHAHHQARASGAQQGLRPGDDSFRHQPSAQSPTQLPAQPPAQSAAQPRGCGGRQHGRLPPPSAARRRLRCQCCRRAATATAAAVSAAASRTSAASAAHLLQKCRAEFRETTCALMPCRELTEALPARKTAPRIFLMFRSLNGDGPMRCRRCRNTRGARSRP